MGSPASLLRASLRGNLLRRGARGAGIVAEVVALTALILAPRCANYRDVFVGRQVYFVDADCYARMTRVRMIAAHPGTIVRQHDFENYPAGITPHTTAPFDYLVLGLAKLLQPFTSQPLDLAGALVSPLLAVCGGWFLCWWSRRLKLRYRAAGLLLYGLSAILVHGTALGRPDHQSLLILLVLVALAAEWVLQVRPTRGWGVVSGISWGSALWVSFYEPLILLGALVLCYAIDQREQLTGRIRRLGCFFLLSILLLAALVERRWPQLPAVQPYFSNWSATVGELRGVGLTNPLWLQWFGGLILLSPLLIALALRRRSIPWAFVSLLALSFLLTIWQARWGYFFAVLFCLTISTQLTTVRRSWLAWLLVAISLVPWLQYWDEQWWPNDQTMALRARNRAEAVEWRAAAASLAGAQREPLLAPWWLSPAAVYWSGQPAVAGSSHESLIGIVDSARFFLAIQPDEAREILREHGAKWVLVYDGERVAENSAAILGISVPGHPFCVLLDRSPSQAPPFLALAGQNSTCKVYRVRD
jgi:hypothetical protein